MTTGLSREEAARRLAERGPNEIARQALASPWALLAGQFKSPLVALLVAAALISGALGEVVDAVAILAIVVINAVVGFVQEYRSESAIAALRAMTAPRARVRRDGRSAVIPAAEVVPGDLLELEAGDLVAADADVREANGLKAVEAALTGESVAVSKDPAPVPADAALADRTDRVFAGTAIATGTGTAEVFATGMDTEVGRIAHLLATAEKGATPLQVRLAAVSRSLIGLATAVVVAVAAIGLLRGQPWLEVLMASVALAVAAVPEGLPAVVTIALAVGVQRMAARNVLVRRLPAVETLGCATVICTDKTGTLTTGSMAVREIRSPDADKLNYAIVACCDAELGERGAGVGDPTELALLVAAAERGLRRPDVERDNPRRAVQPFDSTRKRMSVLRADGRLFVKGAPEVVLPLCSSAVGGPARLAAAEAENEALAALGLRVLAVAVGEGPDEEDLTFLGLVGLADPPRPEAIAAIAAAHKAGIRVVMITGDHPVTAAAIARELGVLGADEPPDGVVHARATPEDKLRIVREWRARGAVVAMTGDGVNDAPAIREAHVGVAMGIAGTEVTREAADVVLTDDNFASIVAGVREGRAIYDNIRKTLVYLLTGNAAELVVVLGASILGLPMPLAPLALLWINLVTDGLPALALVTDPAEDDALDAPPRAVDEPMLGPSQWRFIGAFGALEGVVVLGLYAAVLPAGVGVARSVAFLALVLSELLRALAARSPRRVFLRTHPGSNPRLLWVVALTIGLQAGLMALPAARALVRVDPLSPTHAALALAAALIPVTAVELWKLIPRRRVSQKAG